MHDPRTTDATVKAVDGVVVIDGIGCMAVTMTPEVAAKVSDQLLYAAAEATGQQIAKRDAEQERHAQRR
jgi:hypothetical protein